MTTSDRVPRWLLVQIELEDLNAIATKLISGDIMATTKESLMKQLDDKVDFSHVTKTMLQTVLKKHGKVAGNRLSKEQLIDHVLSRKRIME
jgi:hypothetical protein